MRIDEFDTLPAAEAVALAAVWAAIPRWAQAVGTGRPYGSVAALAARADALADQWTIADLDAALSRHPRIGATVTGSSAEAAASRREQSAMAGAPADVAADMAEAGAAYEARFGRLFLIRAAGRSADEMLAEARRRLGNDDATEAGEALDQLRQIALLRLRTAVTDDPTESTDLEERA